MQKCSNSDITVLAVWFTHNIIYDITFAVFICGVSYSYKRQFILHGTLSYISTHIILLKLHIYTFRHA